MGNKLKYFIITITLVLIVLPFILLTDIFPFLRFGMFAEPVRQETQKEKLVVTYLVNENEKEFDPKEAGIGDNTFYYLARNYYYRKEADSFLEKTSQLVPIKATEWRLKRIIFTNDNELRGDTVTVAKILL